MLYQRGTWTCPAAGLKTSDKDWDRAFLAADQFAAKYGADEVDAAQAQAEPIPS
jgi:hypothetical protein